MEPVQPTPTLVNPKPGVMKEFARFVSEQGVLGLAIGFIFGAAVSDLVGSLVSDIVDPVLGLLLGRGKLESAALVIGSTTIAWGRFLSAIIDFAVIAIVVFLMIRFLHIKKFEPRVSISRR